MESDALHRYDETITVGSEPKDKTPKIGTDKYHRYNEVGNFQQYRSEKPKLINSSKGGSFEQGKTIRISPSFHNAVLFQWVKDGIPLDTCTGPVLEISNANLYHSGAYALIASNQFGIEITPPINIRIM